MVTGKGNIFCTMFIVVMILTLAGLSWKFSETECFRSTTKWMPRPHVRTSYTLTGGHGTSYTIPDDKILANLTESEMVQIYGKFVSTISVLCRDQARFGTYGDGGKEVCLDAGYKPTNPCVVYSFGSNFQFDFELAVKKYLGCEIYTFDPTLDLKGTGKGRTIPEAVHFIEDGLAGKNHVTKEAWPMKTLSRIMKDNGHENTTIDILKLDIEGYEWEAIPEILESGAFRHVKQLLVETHFGHMYGNLQEPLWLGIPMTRQLRALRMLEEYGFGLFMRTRDHGYFYIVEASSDDKVPSQNELSFINMAYLPK